MHHRWKRVMLAAGTLATLWFTYSGVSVLVEEYMHGQAQRQQIIALDPQNPAELNAAINEAMKMYTLEYGLFGPESQDILGLLINERTDGSGHGTYTTTRKPWVTDDIVRHAEAELSDHLNYFGSSYNESYQDAAMLWWNKPRLVWCIASRLLVGVGCTGVVAFALPYLLIMGLLCLVITRGVSVDELYHLVHDNPNTTIVSGDLEQPSSSLTTQTETDAVPSTPIGWGCILILVGSIVTKPWRRVVWLLQYSISSRGPPSQKGNHMSKFFCAMLVALIMAPYLVPSVSAQDTTTSQTSYTACFQFGEWANGKGSGVTFVCDGARVKVLPFFTLDGTVLEVAGLYYLAHNRFMFQAGPVIGGMTGGIHSEAYGGVEFRSSFRLTDHWSVFTRFASRHTAERKRLNNLCIGQVNYQWSNYTLHVGWQSVSKVDTDRRISFGGQVRLSAFTLSGESRISTQTGYLTTHMVVDIPLPL